MLVVAFPWIRRIYADRGYRGNFIEEAKNDFGIDIEITHSNYSGQFVPAKEKDGSWRGLSHGLKISDDYAETTKRRQNPPTKCSCERSLRL